MGCLNEQLDLFVGFNCSFSMDRGTGVNDLPVRIGFDKPISSGDINLKNVLFTSGFPILL